MTAMDKRKTAANARGSQKKPLSMIGNSKNPYVLDDLNKSEN
jgi:hypothetical protein